MQVGMICCPLGFINSVLEFSEYAVHCLKLSLLLDLFFGCWYRFFVEDHVMLVTVFECCSRSVTLPDHRDDDFVRGGVVKGIREYIMGGY